MAPKCCAAGAKKSVTSRASRHWALKALPGRAVAHPISLQLIGTNIEQVGRAAKDLENRIRQYEGVFDIRNSYERGTA